MQSMQIMLKNYQGKDFIMVYAEIIDNIFAVHRREDGWIVSHILSGWHLMGDYDAFNKREQAIEYAQALASAPVIWFFTTQKEMFELNDRKTLTAISQGARLAAEMLT